MKLIPIALLSVILFVTNGAVLGAEKNIEQLYSLGFPASWPKAILSSVLLLYPYALTLGSFAEAININTALWDAR